MKRTTARSNPVALAIQRRRIRRDLDLLLLDAQIHALFGAHWPNLLNLTGRLVYITLGAATAAKMTTEDPDLRILLGTGEALGDLRQDHRLEQHRPALAAGLFAVERLLPQLRDLDLAAAALEVDARIAGPHGIGTQDLHQMARAA